MIKHDVYIFVGCSGCVATLNELGSSLENVLKKKLELYMQQQPNHVAFMFIHCWLFLKDIPYWVDMKEQLKCTPPNPKCKNFKGEKEIPNKVNEIANMKMEKKKFKAFLHLRKDIENQKCQKQIE